MSHTYPAIWWGSVDDLSSWSQTGTCEVQSGYPDPFGSTTAYVISDNDTGAVENRYIEYTATATGYHTAMVPVAGFASDQALAVKLQNMGSGQNATLTITLTNWEPTYATAGDGFAAAVPIGGGFYAVQLGVVGFAGQTMRLTIYPVGETASATGSCKVYLRNLCLLDVLDQPVVWEEPREGSAWVQGASGVEDAWIQGTDYRLSAVVGWVPPALGRSSPAVVSPWGLPNERIGINTGVGAMLRAGRRKDALFFMPERIKGFAFYGTTCTLVEPMRGAPEVLPNGDVRFRLELRATTPFAPFGFP